MKTYWFAFYKSDLLLEKQADGTYTIPQGVKCPVNNAGCYVHDIDTDSSHAVKTFRLKKTGSTSCARCAGHTICCLSNCISKRESVRRYYTGTPQRNTVAHAVRRCT